MCSQWVCEVLHSAFYNRLVNMTIVALQRQHSTWTVTGLYCQVANFQYSHVTKDKYMEVETLKTGSMLYFWQVREPALHGKSCSLKTNRITCKVLQTVRQPKGGDVMLCFCMLRLFYRNVYKWILQGSTERQGLAEGGGENQNPSVTVKGLVHQ